MDNNIRKRKKGWGVLHFALLVLTLGVTVAGAFGIIQASAHEGYFAPGTPAVAQLDPTPLPTVPELTSSQFVAPTPEATMGVRTAKIRAVGDVMMHANQLAAGKMDSGVYDFSSFFADIRESLESADYTIVNLETTLAGAEKGYAGYPQFNSPDTLLDALKACGVDYIGTANNHCLDTGLAGAKRTIEQIRAAGFEHSGTNLSAEDKQLIPIVDINGIKVSIMCYSEAFNGLEPVIPAADLNYLINRMDKTQIIADYNRAKSLGADVAIVYLHWGAEYKREPSADMRGLAQDLLDAGVDIILGSHPHMVQPITRKNVSVGGQTKEGIVVYSMGNFISDQRDQYRDSGIIFEVNIEKNMDTGAIKFLETKYVPTYVARSESGGKYEYRILPAGKYANDSTLLNSLPAATKTRLTAVWNEMKTLIGQSTAVPANE